MNIFLERQASSSKQRTLTQSRAHLKYRQDTIQSSTDIICPGCLFRFYGEQTGRNSVFCAKLTLSWHFRRYKQEIHQYQQIYVP